MTQLFSYLQLICLDAACILKGQNTAGVSVIIRCRNAVYHQVVGGIDVQLGKKFFSVSGNLLHREVGEKIQDAASGKERVAGIQDRIAVFICECDDAVLICGKDALKGIVHDIGHLGTAHFLS